MKDGDRTKSQKDRVDKHEREGKIDMATLPVAVRRRLCRPRWCKEYLLGCCERSSRSLPHHSESVVAETKEKGSCIQRSGWNSCWNSCQEEHNSGISNSDSSYSTICEFVPAFRRGCRGPLGPWSREESREPRHWSEDLGASLFHA